MRAFPFTQVAKLLGGQAFNNEVKQKLSYSLINLHPESTLQLTINLALNRVC